MPNLNQVITEAAANAQYTDMDAVMTQEREAIQEKEKEEASSSRRKKGL